jgi:hypothetical protein
LAATVTGDNLRAELRAFTISHSSGGDEIREVPFAYVPNLIAKVADMVSAYERYKKKDNYMSSKHDNILLHRTQAGLTWHSVMPTDTLWLKLGGDKVLS